MGGGRKSAQKASATTNRTIRKEGNAMDRIYYELKHNGKLYFTAYDSQEVIKRFCDMVNGYGIDPDEIETLTYINGKLRKEGK